MPIEGVRVDVGGCRCPGSPHATDWVELRPTADPAIGAAVMAAIRETGDDEPMMLGQLARIYVTLGIRAWSFVGDDGRPVPVRPGTSDWPETVAGLLPWDRGGKEVAERGDELYSEAVLRPLLPRSSTPSPDGPTAASTSPASPSGSTPPRRSSRSSRTRTAGRRSGDPAP